MTSSGSPLKSWSRNVSHVVKLEHVWIIEQFSLLPEVKGECIYSTDFADLSSNLVKWRLQLYPNGDCREESQGCRSLFLLLVHHHEDSAGVMAKYRLTI